MGGVASHSTHASQRSTLRTLRPRVRVSSHARTGRRVVAKKRQRENRFRDRDLRRGPRLARARVHARLLARVSAGGWLVGRFLTAALASF